MGSTECSEVQTEAVELDLVGSGVIRAVLLSESSGSLVEMQVPGPDTRPESV